MNRRTFETISKYIAGTHKTRVMFDHPGEGACASPKTGEIHMPGEIASHNALAALALLMHEAAHIKHSTKIPEKLCEDPIRKDIINALEDARIDMKNFNKMYNIVGFYERMYRDHKKPDPKKVPLPVKLLINQILKYESFGQFKYSDKATREWERNNKQETDYDKNLQHLFYYGVDAIENEDWKELKEICEKIRKLLQIDKPLSQMMPSDLDLKGAMQGEGQQGQGQGQGQGQDGKGQAQGKGKGKGGKDGKQDKDGPAGQGTDKNYYDGINIIDAILHPQSILARGSMEGSRGDQIGATALQEQTRQKFKELLNMKQRARRDDGNVLDVDNLIALHTGEVEELFKEEIIKHEKKSKIMILMDCSGSMSAPLLDGKDRQSALCACVKAVTDILDEVIELEGINVDYELAAFNTQYIKLEKEDWARTYMGMSGGTNFHRAFHEAITSLANDNSIDGKKMIVCFSDGDVCDSQINDVKNDIIKYGSDVRAMVIGIGTDPCGSMCQNIVGDNIVLAEENADLVLLDTIGEML
jgi:hypothetical protein